MRMQHPRRLLSCFDVYGSQIASADSGKVLNSNPARRFRLTATLWHFHRVAVSLTYMYAVHVRRTCTPYMYARPAATL